MNLGCHGITERCLTVNGKQMKICARCFGSCIGHVFSFILFIFGLLQPWYYSVICVCLMLVDWSLQEFFEIMSNNTRRVITGVLGGFGIGCLIWGGIAKIINILINLIF